MKEAYIVDQWIVKSMVSSSVCVSPAHAIALLHRLVTYTIGTCELISFTLDSLVSTIKATALTAISNR